LRSDWDREVVTETSAEISQLGWRLPVAVGLFLTAIACPIVGTAILSSDASGPVKAAAGLLFFPVPEVFDVSAIAVLGKPGWEWLKGKLFGLLRRAAPPDQVGPTRYRIGLVMFVLPLLMGWLGPYFTDALPGPESQEWAVHLIGDLLFLSSFFVLGGDFWDKLRALFVHGARAVFPEQG
jgi:hypothetical protein